MLTVFWHLEGVVHIEFLLKGCTITSEGYIQTLKTLLQRLKHARSHRLIFPLTRQCVTAHKCSHDSFFTLPIAKIWHQAITIDVILYYYVTWTDNGSMLPDANTRRQEGKYPTMKVLQGCILKLLHSVNSVPILYRPGNMQSAILLSFVASSSLPHVGFNLPTRGWPAISVHT